MDCTIFSFSYTANENVVQPMYYFENKGIVFKGRGPGLFLSVCTNQTRFKNNPFILILKHFPKKSKLWPNIIHNNEAVTVNMKIKLCILMDQSRVPCVWTIPRAPRAESLSYDITRARTNQIVQTLSSV